MDQPKGGARYWLAGGTIFFALPLMLMSLMLMSRGEYDGVPEAWAEAGAGAYVVVVLSFLFAPIAIVFMGLSAKRPAFHPATMALVAVPLLAATAFAQNEVSGLFEAVLSASPADQLTIIAGSAGERLHLTQISLLMAGFGWGLFGVASVMTVSRDELRFRLGLAAVGALLGLAALVLAFHAKQMSDVFRAVASVHPADRASILGIGLLETESAYRAGMLLLLLAVVACIGTAVVSLSTQRFAGVAVLIFGLGASVSLGLAELAGRNSAFAMPEKLPSWIGAELLDVPGGDWGGGDDVYVEPRWAEQELIDALEENAGRFRHADRHDVGLAATKELSADQLAVVLRFAAAKKVTIELTGHCAPQNVPSPAYAKRFLDALSDTTFSVPVEAGTKCDACEGTARLQGDALVVTFSDGKKEEWKWEKNGARDEDRPRAVLLEKSGGIAELLQAASIAWAHGRHVFIAVPAEQ